MSPSWRRTTVLVLAATCALMGCGATRDEPSTTQRTQQTARGASPREASPPPAPRPKLVRFRATDGEPVAAEYTAAGRHAPGVVLLHEIRGGPDQWDELVPYLHAAGFAILAYQSRPSWIERDRLPDALGAVRWLRARRDVDPRRLALVGASIGASTAVLAMATGARRAVDAAVALSPPDSGDIWALQGKGRYHPHDLLLISDESEASSAEGMLDGAVRSTALRSARPGHGVALLAEPAVRDALLRWLDKRVAR